MSKECRRDDSFVTAIAHCHGDAGEANGEANGDGENGSWCQWGRGKWFLVPRTVFPVPIGLVIYHIL